MKEKFQKPFWYIVLGLFLIVAYQGILPLLYFGIFKNLATSNNFWISNITYAGYYGISLLLLILIFHKRLKKEWIEFIHDPKKFIKIGLSYWLKGFLTMVVLNLIIVNFAGSIAGNESQNREILTAMPIYAITTMCIIGPFIEELVFRAAFHKAFNNKYSFAIVTSLIFASLHVLNGFEVLTLSNMLENWTQFLFLLPYGSLAFFFAFAYYETDNIFTSTIAHCFHNTLSVLAILLIV